MRLLVFPSSPILTNGYGIAVYSDVQKLGKKTDDINVWYVVASQKESVSGKVITRHTRYSIATIKNLLRGRSSTEIDSSDLSFVAKDKIDYIFCGDVIFYRALRKQFPNSKIYVRLHNCYSRIRDRIRLLQNDSNLDIIFKIDLLTFYNLEREIFKDSNTYKIFISEEDRNYYTSNFGRYCDSEVWGFVPNMDKALLNRSNFEKINKLVWYGGLDLHKIDSVRWFIKGVFKKLIVDYPEIEFHLYGGGTEEFHDPSSNIIGHGFYKGNDMPFKNNALYINPDLTGGGVKIKIISYLENGTRFITNPFGFEGYSKDIIDNEYCIVKELDEWYDYLREALK